MKNQNQIELIGHYGSDETHALSAWTSTSRDLTDEKRGRIPALLKFLSEEHHDSPFEKSLLHFLLTAEQASHIHLLKHRIGVSISGESARYRELTDKYYIPADWPLHEQVFLDQHCKLCFSRYHATLKRLVAAGYSRARAKESARFYLPFSNQIFLDVTFNWRSFHHFLRLRNKPNAQAEIRELAKGMLELIKGIPGNPFEGTIIALGHVG